MLLPRKAARSFHLERGIIELRVGESASSPWSDATFDKAFAVHTLYFFGATHSVNSRNLRES